MYFGRIQGVHLSRVKTFVRMCSAVSTDIVFGSATRNTLMIDISVRRSEDMPSAPPLISETYSHKALSPLRRSSAEPFQNHIRKIMQRDVSHPILK